MDNVTFDLWEMTGDGDREKYQHIFVYANLLTETIHQTNPIEESQNYKSWTPTNKNNEHILANLIRELLLHF